jgi:broad specificity phosphatase PhoE
VNPTPLILVRHARPQVMPDQPPASWALSANGLQDARQLGDRLRETQPGVNSVVCSNERKAIETAEALGLGEVRIDRRLREVERPWYENEPLFREAVQQYLAGKPVVGWEVFAEAVARFDAACSEVAEGEVVVSHGTVMSAWLSHTVGPSFDTTAFWEQLRLPDAWLFELSDLRHV